MTSNRKQAQQSHPVPARAGRPQPVLSSGITIGLGAGVGVVLGVLMSNLAVGVAIGVALGAGVGASLDEAEKRRTTLRE